ncbi:hypothetical protein VTO42DRAFT_8682 [Malbranchea cinnamomea]
MAPPAGIDAADSSPSTEHINDYSHTRDYSTVNGQEVYHAYAPNTQPQTSHDSSTSNFKSIHKYNHHPAVNGISGSRNSSRSRSESRQGSTHDQNCLFPNRVDAIGRRDNGASRTGSEGDSLLDLYSRESASRSATSVMEPVESEKHYEQDRSREYETVDDEFWIHRDKLAKIESEELQQLGIHIPPAVLAGTSKHGRSHSRRRTRSRDSHSRLTNGFVDHSDHHRWTGNREEKPPRLESPVRMEGASQDDEDNGETRVFEDPRLPEEIAADPYEDGGASRVYHMPVLRTSNSRIPILSTSRPVVSHESSHRSRNNTITSRDDAPSHQPKSRRGSESAPRALETPEPAVPAETTPAQTSRPSSRHASATQTSSAKTTTTKTSGTPSTATRKASTPANNRKTSAQKSRTPGSNGNTPNQRPTTRSGDRPTTAINRPEGDPPWLATMYKPDPRLPPEQQILPTHARRLAQEQWEREGKVPSTYDKDFAPLAIHPDKPTQPAAPEPEKSEESPAPPPPPETKQETRKMPDPAARPGTSGTDHGGYKTMPTVQPTSTTTISAAPRPRPMGVEEPTKEKKGCGCCIVM